MKVIAIVFAVLAFAATSVGTMMWLRNEPAPSANVDQPWVEATLGPIAFESPWRLPPEPLEIPPESKSYVRSSTNLTNEVGGVDVSAVELAYREDINPNLDGAADGAIEKVRGQPGTSAVEATKTETTVAGARAIELDVRAQRRTQPLRLHCLVFVLQKELFIVSVTGRADRPVVDALWQRLRASIRQR
jgi:hypothetical protein